jgi:hypothetical protein
VRGALFRIFFIVVIPTKEVSIYLIVKLSGRDVSFVDMTAGEDLTPNPSPKERGV